MLTVRDEIQSLRSGQDDADIVLAAADVLKTFSRRKTPNRSSFVSLATINNF